MTALQDWRKWLDERLGKGQFQEAGAEFAQMLHQKVLDSDEDTREAVDVLHGKQLGHPLHPVLTDMTIGSWTLGVFFDVVAFFTRSSHARSAGDVLTGLGTLTAVPTAMSGAADFSGIKEKSAGYGAAHGLLNGMALFCFARSVIARTRDNRGRALYFSLLGLGFMTLSAWIGGDMVYRQKVGVNHAPEEKVEKWTAVMPAKELTEGIPAKMEVDEQYVLLYREGDQIHAIGAICSHASGPLEEGTFKDGCVTCPWHQSVYDLHDGHVVHGPSAFDQPRFATRIHNGMIEVKTYEGEDNVNIHIDMDETPVDEVEIELAHANGNGNGTAKKTTRTRKKPSTEN